MIVYADTSALVKLFVTEENSKATREMLLQAWAMGTGLLTRAELGAALARGARMGLLSEKEAVEAQRQLGMVWPTWVRIAMDEQVISQAEALAWKYALLGYDAIHLASAMIWQEHIEHSIVLATFDRELWAAAQKINLAVWPEGWQQG
ncbi:MAG: type II toxin-antitoxin system VapC family toxin [Chloroflexota bacterium]|nr:type II toxin-antitoxin system VapC family toxin [Chloroflexota bacterium]